MTAQKFTDKYLQSLKPSEKRRIVWEPVAWGQGNLGIRITPNGVKTWIYMYRHAGKARMQTLGKYPAMTVAEANAAASKAALDHSRGIDPASKTVEMNRSERTAPTVQELTTQYLELYARPRKKSADRDEALLKRNVLPSWALHKAHAITRGDVARLLDRIIARGAGVQANRTRAVLSRMFNWAMEREMVEKNPVLGLPAPVKERARERCLTDAELRKVVRKLDDAGMSQAARLALKLMLCTACRPGEAAGARWEEVDLDEQTWTIPSERSKNGRAHRLPLTPQALAVLEEARALDRGCGAIFPSPQHGKGAPIATGALSQAIKRHRRYFGVPAFKPHDLRRTVETGVAAAGADWPLLQRLLNHTPQGMTARYVRHPYQKEMRAALEAWCLKVEAMRKDEK